jgi:hypothetical protein
MARVWNKLSANFVRSVPKRGRYADGGPTRISSTGRMSKNISMFATSNACLSGRHIPLLCSTSRICSHGHRYAAIRIFHPQSL